MVQAAIRAQRIDDLLEGRRGVRAGILHGLAGAPDQIARRRIAGQIDPQDESIRQLADDARGAFATGGDRSADRHVVAAGGAAEQRREERQQNRQGRGVFRGAERQERRDDVGRDLDRMPAGALRRNRRQGAIGRKQQRFDVVQRRLPPRQIGRQRLIVGIGRSLRGDGVRRDRQRRQGIGEAGRERPVKRDDLAAERAPGIFIADGGVDDQRQHMRAGRALDQMRPHERAAVEIERRADRFVDQDAERRERPFVIPARHLAAESRPNELDGGCWPDALDGRSIPVRDRRPQCRMPGDQRIERPLQRGVVEPPFETNDDRNGVRGPIRKQALLQPDAALGRQQRRDRFRVGRKPQP